jgi:hypothetical protein
MKAMAMEITAHLQMATFPWQSIKLQEAQPERGRNGTYPQTAQPALVELLVGGDGNCSCSNIQEYDEV